MKNDVLRWTGNEIMSINRDHGVGHLFVESRELRHATLNPTYLHVRDPKYRSLLILKGAAGGTAREP